VYSNEAVAAFGRYAKKPDPVSTSAPGLSAQRLGQNPDFTDRGRRQPRRTATNAAFSVAAQIFDDVGGPRCPRSRAVAKPHNAYVGSATRRAPARRRLAPFPRPRRRAGRKRRTPMTVREVRRQRTGQGKDLTARTAARHRLPGAGEDGGTWGSSSDRAAPDGRLKLPRGPRSSSRESEAVLVLRNQLDAKSKEARKPATPSRTSRTTRTPGMDVASSRRR